MLSPRGAVGVLAGNTKKGSGGKTYVNIVIHRKTYRAHRLAFLLMTMSWPPEEVDHADGDGTNNRWSNLSLADRHDNTRNCRRSKSNSSSVTGVTWSGYRWRAHITVNYRRIHLGMFEDIEDARAARKAAEALYGFHPNHGQDRPL